MESTVRVGFVGAGNMAYAILSGIYSKRILPIVNIMVSNRSAEKLDKIKEMQITTTTSNEEVYRFADIIFICVKPQNVTEVHTPIIDTFKGKTIVSVCAGVSITTLQTIFPTFSIVRIMPNLPCQIGLGTTAMVINPQQSLSDTTLKTIESILSCTSEVIRIEEHQIDCFTAIAGSSPAFAISFFNSLITSGIKHGLSEELARKAVLSTMIGSASMLMVPQSDASQLCARVMSPGGTTEAGMKELEKMKFNHAVESAVDAAIARAKQLSTGK